MPLMKVPLHAIARGTLITYGVAAGSWLLTRSTPAGSPLDYAGSYHSLRLLLAGLALQIVLIILGIVIQRHVSAPELAARAMRMVEILGDGVTVLLFALATFGAIGDVYDRV